MRLHALVFFALGCAPRPTADAPVETSSPVAATSEPPTVDYRMSPVLDGDAIEALEVEVRFATDASGSTRVNLPEIWASERELWKYVQDLSIVGGTTIEGDAVATRIVKATPGAEIVVRYRIVSAYDHEPRSDEDQPFAPIVRPTWFYAFGEALFATPDGRDSSAARFTWDSDVPFASDLQQFAYDGGTVADVRDSIAMGGAGMRDYSERVQEAPIRVAMLGEFTFADDAFVRTAREIIAAERDFWGEHGEPFTIVVAPLLAVQGSRSLGGTGRGDAFTIIMSEDSPIDPIRHLIAHEYFHTWNADRLGGQQDGELEMAGKWFSEGFTEFYTWRLLLRAGLYRLEDFVADWNAALEEYAASPVRNEPNARILVDYWNVPEVGRLPYRRGPLLAAIWEQRLREATRGQKGLDDVLHAMRAAVAQAGDEKVALDAATHFVKAYEAAGGPDLQADLERFVERGETITLPADVFGPCVRVIDDVRPNFARGWDSAATQAAGNVVTGLRKGSPAHRAGLRNGMKLVRRIAGKPGDARQRYVVRVHDGKRERTIRFMPRGTGEQHVQKLELTAADRDACTRTLAGLATISPKTSAERTSRFARAELQH